MIWWPKVDHSNSLLWTLVQYTLQTITSNTSIDLHNRITEWFGLERALKTTEFQPSCCGKDQATQGSIQPGLVPWMGGTSTAPLDKLSQCLITLWVTNKVRIALNTVKSSKRIVCILYLNIKKNTDGIPCEMTDPRNSWTSVSQWVILLQRENRCVRQSIRLTR